MATGLLIRVGIDSTSGGWNAPCCERCFRFCYVPISEEATLTEYYDPAYQPYGQVVNAFIPKAAPRSVRWPRRLPQQGHFDPDFQHLTYGDWRNKAKRIWNVFNEEEGDNKFIVFYAGLRSIQTGNLVYSIIGFYTVNRIVPGPEVARDYWDHNAHTRNGGCDDEGTMIVFADRHKSGRLCKYIPIGSRRKGAKGGKEVYRVTPELLDRWGGLDVRDGYIQRSAFLPRFRDGDSFLRWFYNQNPELISEDNPQQCVQHHPCPV